MKTSTRETRGIHPALATRRARHAPPPADVTLCIFRRWRSGRKEVIALFPEEPHDPNGFQCDSYMHTGQHGGADYTGCITATRPASLDEPDVAALRRELEGEPFNYKLEIRKKAPGGSYRTRRAKLAKQYGTA